MLDEDAIRKLVREKATEVALPREALSGDFITSKEFALLLGMSTNRPRRRLLVYLSMISQGRNLETIPWEIRECFVGHKPVVYVYQGSGSVNYEYRIAIKDLHGKFQAAAKEMATARTSVESVYVKPATLKQLKYLSIRFKTDISSVIDILVNKELEGVRLNG